MNPKLKNILIFAGIFILLVVAYVIFFGNKTDTPALVTTGGTAGSSTATTTGTSTVGREFLTTLLNIRNIKLDDSIFSDPAFASLQDFELTLIQETNPGRVNPFLPLGNDASATSSTTPTTPPASTTPSTTPTGSGTPSAGFPTSPNAPAAGN